jgi:hypothetical protein
MDAAATTTLKPMINCFILVDLTSTTRMNCTWMSEADKLFSNFSKVPLISAKNIGFQLSSCPLEPCGSGRQGAEVLDGLGA